MDLEDIMLSEKSQTEKDKWLYDLTYVQNLKKPIIRTKTRMVVSRGQGGDWKQVMLVEGCVQRVCKFNHPVMSDSVQPTRLLCPWNFSGKNIAVVSRFLLQGIFPTQRSNLCLLSLLHWAGGFSIARWLSGKESACQAGDTGLIPGSGRSPGGGNGNPLKYFCLKNPMDRGAWRAKVQGIVKSQTWLREHQPPGKPGQRAQTSNY